MIQFFTEVELWKIRCTCYTVIVVPFFTKVALWKVWWSSYCFIYNGDAAGTTTSPDGMHLEESVKRTQGHPYDWQLINTNSYIPTKFNRQDKGYIVYRVSWTEQLGMKQVYEIPVPPHASCATYLTQSQNGSRESSLWAELVHLGEQRISFFGGLLSQYKLYSLAKIISFIAECNQKNGLLWYMWCGIHFPKKHVSSCNYDSQYWWSTVKCSYC